jgi:hypothetical protein
MGSARDEMSSDDLIFFLSASGYRDGNWIRLLYFGKRQLWALSRLYGLILLFFHFWNTTFVKCTSYIWSSNQASLEWRSWHRKKMHCLEVIFHLICGVNIINCYLYCWMEGHEVPGCIANSVFYFMRACWLLWVFNNSRSSYHLIHSLFTLLYHPYYSCDMYIRPTLLFDLLPL